VILAVDSAGDRDTLGVCEELADRRYTVESSLPERVLGWLHSQCSCEWILRLDDDEVPSQALLDGLPGLVSERRLTHVRFQRRWLFPDADHYLAELPWSPDYQTRLVRNLPGIWSFAGRLHTNVEVLGEGRLAALPIYHANALVQPLRIRREKSLRYSQLAHGQERALAGTCLYLPEEAPAAATKSVAEDDRRLIAALLDGAIGDGTLRTSTGGTSSPGPVISRRILDRMAAERGVSPCDYRATIRFHDAPQRLPAGAVRAHQVVVENLGGDYWPSGVNGGPPIRVGHRWLDSTGRATGLEGDVAPFPETVEPGGSTLLELTAVTPDQPGAYLLEVDVVHEGVRWFGRPARVPVEVMPQPRVGLSGEPSPYRHLGDDAIFRAHLAQLATFAAGYDPFVFHPNPLAMGARFGHRAVESVHAALVGDLPPTASRARQLLRLVPRTAGLLRAARRQRRGLAPRRGGHRYHSFLSDLSRLDLLVVAGAGSLTSAFSARALWPQMTTALAARRLGVPVVVSGVSVGPFAGIADRLIAGAGLRSAAAVTVRDGTVSKRRLRRLGVPSRRVSEVFDDAVVLEPAPAGEVDQVMAALELHGGAGFVAVSLHRWPGAERCLEPLAGLLQRLALAERLAVVFVPHVAAEPHDDRSLAHELAARLPAAARFRLLDPLPADDVVVGLIGRARLAIGTRYHHAVFAYARGVPAIGIHADRYTREKLEGLARMAAGRVVAMPATAGPELLAVEADQLLRRGTSDPLPRRRLPEIELLRGRRC
jgi:polysaccharide pyruvyl transferase WcaK-like protein